jgi:tetratricopeptide (TPR) repeat protein
VHGTAIDATRAAASSDLQVTLYLADSLCRSGQWALAVDQYRWAGAAFTQRGQAHNALAVYAILERLLPHCLHTQGMVAELYRRLGRLTEAAGAYERVAEAHRMSGRMVEAAHVYRIVVQIDPASVPRRVRLAEILVLLGEVHHAVHHFEVAAGQLLAGGQLRDYVWTAKRLLSLQPDHAPTLRELVRLYLGCHDLRRAVRQLGRLLRVFPRDDVGRELLAACLAAHGRPDRAAYALRLLAQEVKARGVAGYDKAKLLLQRAVALNPYDRPAQRAQQVLAGELAELARRDFAEARVTGVIENVPSAELLAQGQPDEVDTNVRLLRRPGVPIAHCDPTSSPYGQVIYAQFA